MTIERSLLVNFKEPETAVSDAVSDSSEPKKDEKGSSNVLQIGPLRIPLDFNGTLKANGKRKRRRDPKGQLNLFSTNNQQQPKP